MVCVATLLPILQFVPDQLPVEDEKSRSAAAEIISEPKVASVLLAWIVSLSLGVVVPIPTFPVLMKEFSPAVPARWTRAEEVAVEPKFRESVMF